MCAGYSKTPNASVSVHAYGFTWSLTALPPLPLSRCPENRAGETRNPMEFKKLFPLNFTLHPPLNLDPRALSAPQAPKPFFSMVPQLSLQPCADDSGKVPKNGLSEQSGHLTLDVTILEWGGRSSAHRLRFSCVELGSAGRFCPPSATKPYFSVKSSLLNCKQGISYVTQQVANGMGPCTEVGDSAGVCDLLCHV